MCCLSNNRYLIDLKLALTAYYATAYASVSELKKEKPEIKYRFLNGSPVLFPHQNPSFLPREYDGLVPCLRKPSAGYMPMP